MRYARLLARAARKLLVALPLTACGGASTTPPTDAGVDAADATPSAPPDAGSVNVPLDAAPPPAVDGGSRCDALRRKVDSLLPAAAACNPSADQQCVATTHGICCDVTVSFGNTSAIDDYDNAVATYLQQCKPDCSHFPCTQAPSRVCSGSGTTGICE